MATTKKPAAKRKGNPVKQAEQLRISQIGDFKKRMGGIMELPSGAVVKLRNPGGLQAFIGPQSADVPNKLMTIIQESLKKGQAPKMSQFVSEDGQVEPEMMASMTAMMDQVMVRTVVEPEVHFAPTQADLDQWNRENPDDELDSVEELRREDHLYADEFPDADKQFVFQWVTGAVKDLETFRLKQQQMLDPVESEPNTEGDAK